MRFDDMIADALELGELKVYPEQLPEDISDRISAAVPEHLQEKVSCLVVYYLAHRRMTEIGWFCRSFSLTLTSTVLPSVRRF